MTRILHLIDTLHPGGAERVAVNLCNALNNRNLDTTLCASRAEGLFFEFYAYKNQYLFLQKRNALDFRSFFKLASFIKKQKIALVHAHSTSLYWAVALKLICGNRLIWHDHFGNRPATRSAQQKLLRFLSRFIDGVICVNETNKHWVEKYLSFDARRMLVLQHFTTQHKGTRNVNRNVLKLICVANLRPEKGHTNLIEALRLLKGTGVEFEATLVGADIDRYYQRVLSPMIKEAQLEETIKYLGIRTDIPLLLSESDIGVLSSEYEGLPVSLLEYGMAGLACVCTNVGACASVLLNGEAGLIVAPHNPGQLALALSRLIRDEDLREHLGKKLQKHVTENYSEKKAVDELSRFYQLCSQPTKNIQL
ncbi:MAG: glycosyltransferase [Saprospiraceae bacterium]|nr:glycosyltransferase [Saprospiraceae bacterium]